MSDSWTPPPFDPELDELFASDPELLQLARRVRDSRPEPVLDPRFRAVLRARLVREAHTALAPRRSRFQLRGFRIGAWATFGVGAALAAAAIFTWAIRQEAPGAQPALAVVTTNVGQHARVDPHQAITVSFNQPMDTSDTTPLVTQLKIQPATAFTVAWKSASTLVVIPTHPLATDTVYRVTIPKAAVRSQSGAVLKSGVTITFGTSPTPTPSPTPSPLPTLPTTVVGPAAPGGVAFWAQVGAVGVSSTTAGQPSPTPTATPAPTASPNPGSTASPASTPAASPFPSPAAGTSTRPGDGAATFPTGQAPLALSNLPASAVSVSPNGFSVALALTQPNGTSVIEVESAQSTDPVSTAEKLWPVGNEVGAQVTALAWASNYQINFVTPAGIETVNLSRVGATLYPFEPGASADGVVLAPNGRYAFIPADDRALTSSTTTPTSGTSGAGASASPAPSLNPPSASPDDGWLIGLPGQAGEAAAATQLPGSAGGVVAFSGNSEVVAWSVGGDSGSATVVEVPAATPGAAPKAIPGVATPGIEDLALNQTGGDLAYTLDPGGLTVTAATGGIPVGTSPDLASSLAFSPDGSQLAYVADGSLKLASLTPPPLTTPSLCSGADQVLSQFVTAQVSGQLSELGALSGPGVAAAAQTPGDLSRGYVISASCAAGSGSSGAALTASARLIVDPSPSVSGEVTDETVVLGQSQGGWLVSSLQIPPLHSPTQGPSVLSVSVTPPSPGGETPESVVTVTFDSDLNGADIDTASIWLESDQGTPITLLGPPSYDPDTRQVSLVVSGTVPAGAEVVVEATITDIDGDQPAAAASYPVGG
ncbi:MAG: Ig-like domain-containing protein [Candidatus Dormiibacterota bacterium]